MVSSFRGCVHDEADIASIILGAYASRLAQVGRRMSDAEKKAILPGDIFVYQPGKSGIRRWTDGWKWSPSRISHNFMVYRADAMVKKCAVGTVHGEKYCVVVYARDECVGQCASAVLGPAVGVKVHRYVKRPSRPRAEPAFCEERSADYRSEKFAQYMTRNSIFKRMSFDETNDEMDGFRKSVFNDINECEMYF